MTDEEYNAQRAEKQKKIDAILDKIAKNGYESLTKDEKEFLFKTEVIINFFKDSVSKKYIIQLVGKKQERKLLFFGKLILFINWIFILCLLISYLFTLYKS